MVTKKNSKKSKKVRKSRVYSKGKNFGQPSPKKSNLASDVVSKQEDLSNTDMTHDEFENSESEILGETK